MTSSLLLQAAGSGKWGLGPVHSSDVLCMDILHSRRASLHPLRTEAGIQVELSLSEVFFHPSRG